MGHFVILVDPDRIEGAGTGLVELGNHLTTRAGEVRGAIPSIARDQWSGVARTSIDQETQGLADQLARFGPLVGAAGEALKTLSGQVRTAKDVTLVSINTRYDNARSEYQDAVGGASTAVDGETELERRDTAWVKLRGEYDDLVAGLRENFRTAGAALRENCVVAVPDEIIAEFVARGGSGRLARWTGPDGVEFPPELGVNQALEEDLALAARRDALEDGQRVADLLADWAANGSEPPPDLPPEVAVLSRQHGDDAYFGQALATGLGPVGVIEIMSRARSLTGPNAPTDDDPGAEAERLAGIQDQIATTLGVSLAAGSRAPGGLPGYARTIVEEDAQIAGFLFKYADGAGAAFGGGFMREAGTALVQRESGDPGIWGSLYGDDPHPFGSDPDLDEDGDPTLWFLRAADNGTASAQGVMGDPDLLRHFLVDQPTWHGRDDAAGDVLRAATIDAAFADGPPGAGAEDSYAYRAAEISSHAMDVTGEGAQPLPGVEQELGGILAVYMADVDRTFRTDDADDAPGVVDHADDAGHPDGWPRYGIRIDKADLDDVLGDVASSESAVAAIGSAAAAYNQLRLNGEAASHVTFEVTAHDSAQLQGYLVSEMVQGDIDDAGDAAARRERIATAVLLPLNLISSELPEQAEDAAPLVEAVIGEITGEAARGYGGDGVQLTYQEANQTWDHHLQILKMQVIIAAHEAGTLPATIEWPQEDGHPKALGQLTDKERRHLAQQADRVVDEEFAPVLHALETGYGDYVDLTEG